MLRGRELLAIPARRSTWQRFVYLGIGVALVAPFGTLAGFVAPVLEGGLGEPAAWTVASVLCFGPLAIAMETFNSVSSTRWSPGDPRARGSCRSRCCRRSR